MHTNTHLDKQTHTDMSVTLNGFTEANTYMHELIRSSIYAIDTCTHITTHSMHIFVQLHHQHLSMYIIRPFVWHRFDNWTLSEDELIEARRHRSVFSVCHVLSESDFQVTNTTKPSFLLSNRLVYFRVLLIFNKVPAVLYGCGDFLWKT